jgi:hypothetical protein
VPIVAVEDFPHLGDQAGQAAAFDELHREVRHLLDHADGVDGHDPGVLKPAGNLRLELKALDCPGVESRRNRQDLEGDTTAEGKLFGFVDDTHPAAADFADDPKVADDTGALLAGIVTACSGSIERSQHPGARHCSQARQELADFPGPVRVFRGQLFFVNGLA